MLGMSMLIILNGLNNWGKYKILRIVSSNIINIYINVKDYLNPILISITCLYCVVFSIFFFFTI